MNKSALFRILSLILMTSSLLLMQGCSNNTPAEVVSSPEVAYYTEGAAATYTLTPTSFDAPSHQVSYPQISGLKDESIMNNINQSLSSEATAMITPEANEDTPIVVTYEIARMDANLLSVVYTGKQVIDGESLILKSALTVDLATSLPITFQNMFKDLKGTEQLNSLFGKKAVESGLKTLVPDDTMALYLTKDAFIISFKDDILNADYSEISIPIIELDGRLNVDFLGTDR